MTSMPLLHMVVHRDNKKEVKKPRETFPLCEVAQITPKYILCKENKAFRNLSALISHSRNTLKAG